MLIRKITKDINKTRPDVALMYLIDEMIMAMALTSVLKLASTKYILSFIILLFLLYTVSNREAGFKKIISSVVLRAIARRLRHFTFLLRFPLRCFF